MRCSNHRFTKGSIIFLFDDTLSDNEAFLKNRPLIVVSNPTHIMDTLIVCTTGTQDKPGICVSFFDYDNGKFIGNYKKSTIYPYTLITIKTYQIRESIGQLDPFIMHEVDKAIDFHLGRSTEIPGYLRKYHQEISEVSYSMIQGKYLRSDSICAEYRATRNNQINIPIPEKETKPKRKYTRKAKEQPSTDIPVAEPPQEITPIPHDYSQSASFLDTYVGRCIENDFITMWSLEHSSIGTDLPRFCKNADTLFEVLDEESISLIVSRIVPITLIAQKYGVNQSVANCMRIALTEKSMNIAKGILSDIFVEGVNFTETSDYIGIGMAILKAFQPETLDKEVYEKYKRYITGIKFKYGIRTSDKKTWKSMVRL